jgi:hypothetical protein
VAHQQQPDLVQTVQMLLNQLASSGQLNLHQPTPSATQPIGQAPPVLGQSNPQNPSIARSLAEMSNSQSEVIEEQPSETPLAGIRLIEQISVDIKSHLKEDLTDQIAEMLQKHFGMKPKQQIYMYMTP